MKRTYEEKSRQLITSVKPTTLNLQPRGFAPPQAELAEDVSILTNRASSENLLKKLISTPTSESSATSVQRKPQNRLKAIRSQGTMIQAKQNDESSAESNLASIHGKPQNRLKAIASQGMAIQAKLNIGKPNDKYEKEADETASKVVQQINSAPQDHSVQRNEAIESEDEELQMKPAISTIQRDELMEEEDLQMKSLVQRRENLGGIEASTDLESSIQSARGSGQLLDASLQTKMGQAMGADFSSVKVHTDSQSDQLNKSIQAKAFTTGQDVFFRQGAYEPSSQSGQELIAHELTHVMQQNANTVRKKDISSVSSELRIQRVSKNNDSNQYYSDVLEGQKITRDNAVFTATSNITLGGGHTSIYIESIDKFGNPKNLKIHLTYGGGDGSGSDSGQQSSSVADSSSGSSSSSGGKSATDEKGVNIEIIDGYIARESVKKSWVVSSSKVVPAVDKARELQSEQAKYSYTLFGVSPFKKKVTNCAKFGEIVLKAAGIKASSGSVFKIPSSLTKGKNKGYENTLDKDIEENQKKKEVLKQEKFELEKQKYAKPINQNNLRQLDDESASDEFDNSEAQDWLVNANRKAFDLANDLPARKCNRDGGRANQLITLDKGRKIMICEDLGNGEVLIDAGQPILYCKTSLLLLFDSVIKG